MCHHYSDPILIKCNSLYIHLSHEDWPILSHAYNRIDVEHHPARHYSMFLAPFNAIKKEWAIRTCHHVSKFSIEDTFGNYTDERVWLAWANACPYNGQAVSFSVAWMTAEQGEQRLGHNWHYSPFFPQIPKLRDNCNW